METALRSVDRIETKTHLGPDAQADDKNLVISPARPELTDPFLALSEDWFSSPGFNWHPHRGLETVTLVAAGLPGGPRVTRAEKHATQAG